MADEVFERFGFPILRCSVCGLGKTQLPPEFSTEQIYTEGYFQGGRPDGYADYMGSEGILRAEFRSIIEALRDPVNRGGRLLEIGCAYGFFLAEATAHFDDVYGIDASESAVQFCRSRGLNVERSHLAESYIAEHAPFDRVVMLDVVEHLEEPDTIIESVRKAMAPGGRLLISTGDWESRLSRLMGKKWRLMTPPQHTYFFSPRTMTLMLNRLGFDVIECRKPWKRVPFDLAVYQSGRILGMKNPPRIEMFKFGLPVNLFDAFRLVAVRR